MCGIFAYSGSQDIKHTLISGLKDLEYRGYDGAGIAFYSKNNIHRVRASDVKKLETKSKLLNYTGSLGIGHTRWATHGRAIEKNTHPQQAHSLYVVHNGIIENYQDIKTCIKAKNFKSDTDTEVLPHLIHYFMKTQNISFLKSIFKTVKKLEGSYSAVVLNKKDPDTMIAFKSGPTLLFCKSDKGFIISSDPQTISKDVKQIYFLKDEQIVYIKKDKFQFYNFQGKKISVKFQNHYFVKNAKQKNKYSHFMLKEISEQPKVLRQLALKHIHKDQKKIQLKLTKGNQNTFDSILKKSKDLLIIGCGSSYNAALFAKYIFEDITNIKVTTEIASEFIYKNNISKHRKSLVLLISQSGETADILTALKQLKKYRMNTLSLCNVNNSTLDRDTDFTLNMEAGPEISVASTKTFLASLTSLLYFAIYFAQLQKQIKAQQVRLIIPSLITLPTHIEALLSYNQFFQNATKTLKKFKNFFYLGRGCHYPIALEGALKLTEIAYLDARAYPSGEMKHGPLAMIDKNTLVINVTPCSGILYKKSLINIIEAKTRGARIMSIGGKSKDKELKKISNYFLPVPESHPYIQAIYSLIPLQIMAYHISKSLNRNVDKPRNLAKSVTVE